MLTRHRVQLRASAKQQMQRRRAESPSKEQHRQQLLSAAKYRTKNQESIRASDKSKRTEQLILKQRDEDARRAHALQQREHEARARPPPSASKPPTPRVLPSRRAVSPHESESDSNSDSEAECSSVSVISERIFYGEVPQACSPTPDIFFAGAPIHCEPEYFPHPKHKHTAAEHGDNPSCRFYAIFTGDSAGIYNDFSQIQGILNKSPHTKYDSHPDWRGISLRWCQNCDRNHDHWNEWYSGGYSTSASPPSSPSASDISPHHRVPRRLTTTHLCNLIPSSILHLPPKPRHRRSRRHCIRHPHRRRSPRQGHRGVAPTSPSSPTLLPFPASLLPEKGMFPPEDRPRVSTTSPASSSVFTLPPSPSPLSMAPPPRVHQRGSKTPHHAPVDEGTAVYAVSVCNLVFKNHDQAVKYFEDTDGADLLMVHSVSEITEFFAAANGSAASLSTVYAISGHRILFKNREKAYRFFLDKEGAEMIFARSSREAEVYVRVHSY
ncbi:hypothetical protein C8R43DRAFT_963683 [Mycena crocata]|nr:hypothetical protein C8R43DRAFT_963683 [Mycena crocata]